MLTRLFRNKHALWILSINLLLLLIVIALGWIYWQELSPSVFVMGTRFWSMLQETPAVVFFGLMAVLPLLPIPLSPFFLIAGSIYGFSFSLTSIAVVILVNLSLSYYIATGLFRPLIEKIVARFSYRIPEVYPSEHLKISVVLRITPGMPYFVKNLLNGLVGVPFKLYIMVSWPLEMAWAIAFLILGESLFEGSFGLAVSAVSLIIVLILMTKIIRDRYAKSDTSNPVTSG